MPHVRDAERMTVCLKKFLIVRLINVNRKHLGKLLPTLRIDHSYNQEQDLLNVLGLSNYILISRSSWIS